MQSLKSIQDLFQTELMNRVTRVIVVRCKREYEEVYERNVAWLPNGQTGWWPISEEREFGGVVVLLDSAEGNRVEVWAGRALGTSSGKINRRDIDGRWTLQVKGPFQFIGFMQAPGVTSFLGTTPGNLATYIDRDHALDPQVPQWLLPADKRPRRGFDPEHCGDRALVQPGAYSAQRTHGAIVNSLAAWLSSTQGYSNLDNILGWHDLHAYNSELNPELFEVKTDSGNADVYCALGQLHLYELETGPSHKTIVLPKAGNTEAAWHEKLFMLNIGLITYETCNEGYLFKREVPSERWHR
ncbi:hypothetical protein CLU85_1632 [Acidovorax sp. 69]|uniref:hypothetical protein n=1 Tax=Acidovorax sp. 69 TaxID=2035202 RepID=UPI000C235A56|nr:hypothetical protein [Acidovorax sp. 69]PJI96875.1 hypothetical protein CLU85_1632 [Acidovorax sp. 69]